MKYSSDRNQKSNLKKTKKKRRKMLVREQFHKKDRHN